MTRLARLVRRAVESLELDLTGAAVLTEAATGPYVVTPVLAALAGATHVDAVTRDTRHGTVAEVVAETTALADELGVADRIVITTDVRAELFAHADVVTNSGHLRPIEGGAIAAMRPGTALPLMFEAWEIDAGRHDLDLDTLLDRGVLVAGTNERHPRIDVFGYLGLMAAVQLADAGVSAYRGDVVLLCDNPFLEPMIRGLVGAGATVRSAASPDGLLDGPDPDAVVVALTPTGGSVLTDTQLDDLAQAWPGAVLTQFWGDLDRVAAARASLSVWPADPPRVGHMGVLPSRLGPEPVVRLQAGGLKVAQVLLTPPDRRTAQDLEYLDAI